MFKDIYLNNLKAIIESYLMLGHHLKEQEMEIRVNLSEHLI